MLETVPGILIHLLSWLFGPSLIVPSMEVVTHIVPGGTDKSNGGDYENRLRYVKFGGLAILKP